MVSKVLSNTTPPFLPSYMHFWAIQIYCTDIISLLGRDFFSFVHDTDIYLYDTMTNHRASNLYRLLCAVT